MMEISGQGLLHTRRALAMIITVVYLVKLTMIPLLFTIPWDETNFLPTVNLESILIDKITVNSE